MTTPEQIQRNIERTRSELSSNVDRLTDKVSPSRVVHRRVGRIKSSATAVKDRVMGGASESTQAVSGQLQAASGQVADAASRVSDVAGSAPQAVRDRAQGNPIAAGVIAFGVGWLLSSLAPATALEQRVAEQAEATVGDALEPLKAAGQQVAQNLKEPVQESVEQIKNAATDAAQATTEQARSSAEQVPNPMQQ